MGVTVAATVAVAEATLPVLDIEPVPPIAAQPDIASARLTPPIQTIRAISRDVCLARPITICLSRALRAVLDVFESLPFLVFVATRSAA